MGKFSDNVEDEEVGADIDMSPLIDCVFILLIFFIVTTVFVTVPDAETDRPLTMTAQQLERNSILIAVTPNDEVIYGDREIGIAGVQPLVRRMLRDEDLPVVILGDTNAKASTVIRVQNEAKLAQATRVWWATEGAN
ncbi:MAG: ExbD/TolR family protein [Phycisphaeraceae bacterium]